MLCRNLDELPFYIPRKTFLAVSGFSPATFHKLVHEGRIRRWTGTQSRKGLYYREDLKEVVSEKNGKDTNET